LAIRIRCSILIENIKFSARAWSIFIDRATTALFFIMGKSDARCSALLCALHTSKVLCELSCQPPRNDASAIACNFSMIKTHSEVLTALAAFKTRVGVQFRSSSYKYFSKF
jgi:hypothetical protein